LVLHTYVLRVQYSCGNVLVFWFWREIVFGVTYDLSAQYSYAVVSVFWYWWEIVLKMRTRSYKRILLGYFIMRAVCQNTITNKNNSSVDRTVVEVCYMTSQKFECGQSWNRISVGTFLFFGCLSFRDVCIITHHQNLKPCFLCHHQLQVMCFCYRY
jgi:hypothetical protein